MSNKSGCETMNKLWNVALGCNIEQPGIYGVSDRVSGFIQCKNVRDFLVMASLKCWEERTQNKNFTSFPPTVIVDEKIVESPKYKSNKETNNNNH
jgi:hypothetical protein